MLNTIYQLFTLKPAQNPRASLAEKKHLVMQKIYSSQAVPDKAVLAKQKELILNQDRYLVEEEELEKHTVLIGFSKSRLFLGSAYFYTRGIPYTEEWVRLKKLAEKNKIDIAFFGPNRDNVACLKLIDKNNHASRYLIPHGDMCILPRQRLACYSVPEFVQPVSKGKRMNCY